MIDVIISLVYILDINYRIFKHKNRNRLYLKKIVMKRENNITID